MPFIYCQCKWILITLQERERENENFPEDEGEKWIIENLVTDLQKIYFLIWNQHVLVFYFLCIKTKNSFQTLRTKSWDGGRGRRRINWQGGGWDYCIYLLADNVTSSWLWSTIFLWSVLFKIKQHCLNEVLM